MESLRRVTSEHSSAAACRLERNESSAEQANYERLVLETQDSSLKLPVEAATILNFHSRLFQDPGRVPSGFVSTNAADATEELCGNYLSLEASTEPLLLIGVFLLELLRLQPFEAGNKRVALLTSLWLLNRRGFTVSRFVSMERILETRQGEFQAMLLQKDIEPNWPVLGISRWWIFWLEILLQAYLELGARAGALSGRRGIKTDMVLAWIGAEQGDFSIRQIQQQVPECGIELIRKIFKEQKAAGKIKCMGRGPNALWRKKKARRISDV
jgi:hypothetical protein